MFARSLQDSLATVLGGGSIGGAEPRQFRARSSSSMPETAARRRRRTCRQDAEIAAGARRALHRAGRHDGGRQVHHRAAAGGAAQLPFLDADTEIEAAAGHVDPGHFRNPWRAAFPRRRGAGDRAAARRRPGGDRHRRRRLHARGDPQPYPRQGGLDLAQGRCRYDHAPGASAAPTARCCRPPIPPPPSSA